MFIDELDRQPQFLPDHFLMLLESSVTDSGLGDRIPEHLNRLVTRDHVQAGPHGIFLDRVGVQRTSNTPNPRHDSFKPPVLSFEYDEQLPTLRRLIELSEKSQWSRHEIDWERPLGRRSGDYEDILEWHGIFRYDYIQALTPRKREALARSLVAFEFSQILHGEQDALMLAGQLTGAADDLDARLFAANQARDEARHVMAVRDLVQRIGPIFPCEENSPHQPRIFTRVQRVAEASLRAPALFGSPRPPFVSANTFVCSRPGFSASHEAHRARRSESRRFWYSVYAGDIGFDGRGRPS